MTYYGELDQDDIDNEPMASIYVAPPMAEVGIEDQASMMFECY